MYHSNHHVVNCFHFSVSLGYKTTKRNVFSFRTALWIAFIFQYLWDTKQLTPLRSAHAPSCELLSFFSIFGIQNNNRPSILISCPVVNCFHFSVSLGYKTTYLHQEISFNVLWIAFIFQYLWDTKQQEAEKRGLLNSCELLSFFSIFGIQNNKFLWLDIYFTVVNCFHFSVSLGYKTTTFYFRL